MAALLKFVLIFFLISYLIKELFRRFLPQLINHYIKKMNNFQGNTEPIAKEGETIIKSKPADVDTTLKDKGEYVDFEEVD
jgi:hypothetical protein